MFRDMRREALWPEDGIVFPGGLAYLELVAYPFLTYYTLSYIPHSQLLQIPRICLLIPLTFYAALRVQ